MSCALFSTLKKPLNLTTIQATLDAINKFLLFKIMAKAPIYLGARVGRPEKTKERKDEAGSPCTYSL